MTKAKVCAIMVTYNISNEEKLVSNLTSLLDQVNDVVVVDNSDNQNSKVKAVVEGFNNNKIVLIQNLTNLGVSHAQNQGIDVAIQNSADFVLLSDQDSNYPNDYVKTMLIQYQKAISRNEQIAAIGPIYMDTNKGSVSQGFVISNGILNQRIFPARGVYQVAQLISSGMIIPITVFREVGLMLDELFVDWHDLEWCWRARAKGYLVLGCADTYIRHKLGTRVRKTIFGDLTIRSPLRHYYMVRNAIYLALNARYLKTSFRIVLFLKALRNSVIYAIYGKSHFGNVFFCLKGIIDGLLFRMGKCDSNWGLINISDFLKEID